VQLNSRIPLVRARCDAEIVVKVTWANNFLPLARAWRARVYKGRGRGGNPTTKQSRTSQAPMRAITEPDPKLSAANGDLSQIRREALGQTLCVTWQKATWLPSLQQAHSLNSWSLVWQRQGCLSKHCVNF